MRTSKLFLCALSAFMVASMSACNQSSGPSYASGDKIYTERILFDTSEATPGNVHFKIGKEGSVESVQQGRNQLTFGYHDGILTLLGEELKTIGVGERSLNVTFSDKQVKKVSILLATKFIKTVDDYVAINNDKKSLEGIYVLDNDIDFSTAGIIEPIGNFTSEEDPNKNYFHGIFDGNGYSLKNLTVSYSDGPVGIASVTGDKSNYPSNYDVYTGHGKFSIPGHTNGDNIGVFQYIGSSGVVRNTVFDNVKVHGRTIVGVIAGNVAGNVYDCVIKENCEVLMDTHFWDDDCNCGGAFGIVGEGIVKNVVSLTSKVSIRPTYEDYDDEAYKGQAGEDYDHGYSTQNPFWRFWGDDKPDSIDSNNAPTNGVYSFVGKCWGQVTDCVGASFISHRYSSNQDANVFFGQTHLGKNKPSSGAQNLGELNNCAIYDVSGLKTASNYPSSFAPEVWDIVDGQYPALKPNINAFYIAQ